MVCAVREPTRCARGRPIRSSATTTRTPTGDRRTWTPTATWSCPRTPRCRAWCPSTAESSARREISSIGRFAVLASAIASRPLGVEETHSEPTHTDGRTVFVAAGLDAVDVRDAIAVQAALLAGGALRKDLMARLARHRAAVLRRYLALELGRVAERLDHVLPTHTARRMKSAGVQPVPGSSEESFNRASGRERIPSPPAWVGV